MNIPYISAEEIRKNLSMEDAIQCTENVYKLKKSRQNRCMAYHFL